MTRFSLSACALERRYCASRQRIIRNRSRPVLTKCICTCKIRTVRETNRLDACNCFAVRQAARRITRHYERFLSQVELTSAQFSVLVLLDEKNQATMTGLAHMLGMDRTTLLRALKPLQREHLLETRRSAGDARQLSLSLSATGKRKLKEGLRLWQDAQREFEAQVGSERAAWLRRELVALPEFD